MNEPTNPSEPTPPPPPPPPFTPPPSPPTPAAPPPSTPPRPPVYTPPPGQPPKKSALPWVLGGCGCLTLIIIVCVVIAMISYRAKQRVTEFKSDFKSALKSIDENSRSNTYVNEKGKLPSKLQSHFVAFSFDYPNTFELQPQDQRNFVKIEKYAAEGKGNTAENFAVGYIWFDPPSAEGDLLYDKLLDDLQGDFAKSFHNYRELKRERVTVAGVAGRASVFQGDFNDAAKTTLYGKVIMLHPPGKKDGVAIVILGTSLSREVKSSDDLGTKGDTAEILRSFKFL